jgi:hypothetical protein
MISQSQAQEIIEFNAEPAIVAEACQAALKKIGELTSVVRETGTIMGSVPPTFSAGKALLNIKVARKGTVTEVTVAAQAKEGLVTSGGAQRGLSLILKELGSDPRLKGSSTAGW